jgi:mannose-1-phosphate guanylyltransferase
LISHALVLAAGKSTRIAEVSGGQPKPLLSIGGKPVIAHALGWLHDFGIRNVWVNLHYRPNDIRSALGDGRQYAVLLNYSFEPEILGTAGAFRRLANEWKDTTLIVYGDNLVRFDLSAMQQKHRETGALVTIALFDPAVNPNSRIAGGRVAIDSSSRITAFVEGGSTAGTAAPYVNAGVYLVEPAVERLIQEGTQDFARDVFPELMRHGQLCAHVIEPSAYCIGLDTPESYRVAEELVNSHEVTLA